MYLEIVHYTFCLKQHIWKNDIHDELPKIIFQSKKLILPMILLKINFTYLINCNHFLLWFCANIECISKYLIQI